MSGSIYTIYSIHAGDVAVLCIDYIYPHVYISIRATRVPVCASLVNNARMCGPLLLKPIKARSCCHHMHIDITRSLIIR
jgi:hypothetical protein